MKAPILFLILTCIFSCKAEEESSSTALDESNQIDDWYYKQSPQYKGWKYIVIHHSATDGGSVAAFDRFHRDQGYGGIAYHFVIGNGKGMRDGEVQSTFRWRRQMSGTHVSINSWNHNIFGIGICLVGDMEKNRPTKAQKKALEDLIGELQKKYKIPDSGILGHGEVHFDDDNKKREQTLCPGKNLTRRKK